MTGELVDAVARERFRQEWDRNFAISANAGSGKTTAISQRLAAMAMNAEAAQALSRTAVVTYTKKAALEIELRAREVLMRQLMQDGVGLGALDHLEGVFFGTIHSFCLQLAQDHGQTLGISLNPTVVAENDDALWEEFLEQDELVFRSLSETQMRAFRRHVEWENVFALARGLNDSTARDLRRRAPVGAAGAPGRAALDALLAIPAKGNGARNILETQRRAANWWSEWETGHGRLPLFSPSGSAREVVAAVEEWMAPLKRWIADGAASLAGELAERFRAWRVKVGVQTYADQIDAAMAVLRDDELLNLIRADGWRVILDEAQDTDPQQFAVLVEITRPPGAIRGQWPARGQGVVDPPRPGCFCMVGDGQQAIYGSRADIGNFTRHVDAFRDGQGGGLLNFEVTFRAPHEVIQNLNTTLAPAFGPGREHNFGPPSEPAAPAPYLQVPYVPLAAGPANVEGGMRRLALVPPVPAPRAVAEWMAAEVRQVAVQLGKLGPAGLGVSGWSEVAVLAPRNDWLETARREFEHAGLEVSLQTRRRPSRELPAFAWMAGLLAVCIDPEDTFEWVGVLREVWALSDGLIAREIRRVGRLAWDEPAEHAPELARALQVARPFVLRANDEGQSLGSFAVELAAAARLRERAALLDATGSAEVELDRLLAEAATLGLEGAGPREWLQVMLGRIDEGRPAGKPSENAINLLTSHSAKGLEWPVVIPLGLWRGIGAAPDRGFRLIHDSTSGPTVFYDSASLPSSTRLARERERWRELARLLYVTLTRAKRLLVVPWGDSFGGRSAGRGNPSFAALWGAELSHLPELVPIVPEDEGETEPSMESKEVMAEVGPACPAVTEAETRTDYPARLLPHLLAKAGDRARLGAHESGLDEPLLLGGEEAIGYGLWWHETLENVPWGATEAVVEAYFDVAIARAATMGQDERGRDEWKALRAGRCWSALADSRWRRLAELAVFAPVGDSGWVDGVIDLVLHDSAANEVWVVDWKTNRRRSGEGDSAVLERLVAEYAPQLRAYGRCLEQFFPSADQRLLVYSTAVGNWAEITPATEVSAK